MPAEQAASPPSSQAWISTGAITAISSISSQEASTSHSTKTSHSATAAAGAAEEQELSVSQLCSFTAAAFSPLPEAQQSPPAAGAWTAMVATSQKAFSSPQSPFGASQAALSSQAEAAFAATAFAAFPLPSEQQSWAAGAWTATVAISQEASLPESQALLAPDSQEAGSWASQAAFSTGTATATWATFAGADILSQWPRWAAGRAVEQAPAAWAVASQLPACATAFAADGLHSVWATALDSQQPAS